MKKIVYLLAFLIVLSTVSAATVSILSPKTGFQTEAESVDLCISGDSGTYTYTMRQKIGTEFVDLVKDQPISNSDLEDCMVNIPFPEGICNEKVIIQIKLDTNSSGKTADTLTIVKNCSIQAVEASNPKVTPNVDFIKIENYKNDISKGELLKINLEIENKDTVKKTYVIKVKDISAWADFKLEKESISVEPSSKANVLLYVKVRDAAPADLFGLDIDLETNSQKVSEASTYFNIGASTAEVDANLLKEYEDLSKKIEPITETNANIGSQTNTENKGFFSKIINWFKNFF